MDSDMSDSDSSEVPDRKLDEIQKVLHSLDPNEYLAFMKKVHCNCPFKTKELTDQIIQHWKLDHSIRPEKFNEIIEERDADHIQESKEKRQRDVLRIQDMKSRTGLDPLQLFPKEIWMMIHNELSSKDKRSLRQVHKTFQDLTEDTLIGDTLLPLFVRFGFKVERFWRGRSNPRTALFFPLARYTPLRLISKSLRNAVDQWFEDDLIFKLRSGEENARPSVVVCANLQSVRHCRKFGRIKSHLRSSSDPPKHRRFFTRALHLVCPSVHEQDNQNRDYGDAGQLDLAEFSGNLDEILDVIGGQILYFCFEIRHRRFNGHSQYDPAFEDRYSFLMKFLGKMPNLKWLKVTINQNEKVSTVSRHGFSIPAEEPFPALIHLERLDLELVQPNRYVLPVYNKILAAYAHVKILNLQGMKSILKEKNGFVYFYEDDIPAKIPLSPEVLIMHGPTSIRPNGNNYDYDSGGDDDEAIDMEIQANFGNEEENDFTDSVIFQSIIDSKWPLRRLEWEIGWGVNAVVILQTLGGIPTLEKVRLSLENITIRNDSAFPKLPQLEHFELKFKKFRVFEEDTDNWNFFFSLQPMVYAKKLKTLIWKCDMAEKGWRKLMNDTERAEHCGEMLDFNWVQLDLLGFLECGNISTSNIWTVFRSLETVMIDLNVERDIWSGSARKKPVSKKYRRCYLDFEENSSECSSSKSWSIDLGL